MSPHPVAATLTPAGRRALSAFLEGRLPAGRLHEELLRAALPEQPVAAPLPDDTASIPVPPPVPAVAAA